jgi:hypothetical protein
MRFEGLKEGGLYRVIGSSPHRGMRTTIGEYGHGKVQIYSFIPNDAVVMFLRRLDNNNGLVLYEDKTCEIAIGTGGYLRPVAI